MIVGEIYRHREFYTDSLSGALLPKFLLILALPQGGDVVARLLTSRHAGTRPEQPPCHHGDPYPGFYLGIPGSALTTKTWVDLRKLDDLDIDVFNGWLRKGDITLVTSLAPQQLRATLECAASADDTTRQQERSIRDAIAGLS